MNYIIVVLWINSVLFFWWGLTDFWVANDFPREKMKYLGFGIIKFTVMALTIWALITAYNLK